jgi:hypothetical protein
VSVLLRAHDKQRLPLVVPATAVPLFHCDLLQLGGSGWLVRSYAVRAPDVAITGFSVGSVVVGISRDAGVTWNDRVVTVGASITGDGAAPTLARTRWDDLFVFFHGGTAAYGWRSADRGETWALHSVNVGLTYPRLVVQQHRQVLIAHNGTALVLHETDDWGANLLAFQSITAPIQLAAMRVDRRNLVHVIHRTAGDVLEHSYSVSDRVFTVTGTLATGKYPAFAVGIGDGFVTYFSGSTLNLLRLDETYGAVADTAPAPAAYQRGYLGALIARRPHWYALGKLGSSIATRYSDTRAASWVAPV